MAKTDNTQPMVPDYVTDMVKTGSTALAKENPDAFIAQMLEASLPLFQQALDIAKNEAAFRKEAFTILSKRYQEATKANDVMSQKVVDDAYANNALIRQAIEKLLEDGQISSSEFEFLFKDLRYYHNEMKETRRETQAERERMLREEKEAAEAAAKSNGIFGWIAGGIGALLGLAGGYYLGKRK